MIDVVKCNIIAISTFCKECTEVKKNSLIEQASLALCYKYKFMVLVASLIQESFHMRKEVV